MIVFMNRSYYSIEDFVKVNIISESTSGKVWVHMYTNYINPIPISETKDSVSIVTEDLESSVNYRKVTLYTSPQRNFDIRRGMDNYSNTYQFLFSPITGKFILEGELLKTCPNSYCEFWFKNLAFSRRYITENQLKEVLAYSLYNLAWEQERYIFGRLERIERKSIRFKFKFFNRQKMENVVEFLKEYIPFTKDMCNFFLKKGDTTEEVSI